MSLSDFTAEASSHAAAIDRLFYVLVGISIIISLAVFALLLVFSLRYRRGSRAKRGPMPKFIQREVEIGWTSATLVPVPVHFLVGGGQPALRADAA